MKRATTLFLFIACLFVHRHVAAQTGSLLISSGTNVVLNSGTALNMDGLSVQPSQAFTIPGPNSVTRTVSATPAPPTPYIQRVYNFAQGLPLFTGNFTVFYMDAELNGLNESLLNPDVYNGLAWVVYPGTARNTTTNMVTATVAGLSISRVTLTSAMAIPLPLSLGQFSGQGNRCVATLRWTTLNEQNTLRFELEQSSDGINFATAGTIPSAGNSNTEKQYSYQAQLTGSTSYFRLRTVDKDGSSKLSPVISLTSDCNRLILLAYPNPAKNSITISGLAGKNNLRVLNALGETMALYQTSNALYTIQTSNWVGGVYFIQVWKEGTLKGTLQVQKE